MIHIMDDQSDLHCCIMCLIPCQNAESPLLPRQLSELGEVSHTWRDVISGCPTWNNIVLTADFASVSGVKTRGKECPVSIGYHSILEAMPTR